MRVREGMRVDVYSANGKRHLGLGTIVRVEPLEVDGWGIISKKYPSRIELDNGMVREGMTCWWKEIEQ